MVVYGLLTYDNGMVFIPNKELMEVLKWELVMIKKQKNMPVKQKYCDDLQAVEKGYRVCKRRRASKNSNLYYFYLLFSPSQDNIKIYGSEQVPGRKKQDGKDMDFYEDYRGYYLRGSQR